MSGTDGARRSPETTGGETQGPGGAGRWDENEFARSDLDREVAGTREEGIRQEQGAGEEERGSSSVLGVIRMVLRPVIEHFPFRIALLAVAILLLCYILGVDPVYFVFHLGVVPPGDQPFEGDLLAIASVFSYVLLMLAFINLFTGFITDKLKQLILDPRGFYYDHIHWTPDYAKNLEDGPSAGASTGKSIWSPTRDSGRSTRGSTSNIKGSTWMPTKERQDAIMQEMRSSESWKASERSAQELVDKIQNGEI